VQRRGWQHLVLTFTQVNAVEVEDKLKYLLPSDALPLWKLLVMDNMGQKRIMAASSLCSSPLNIHSAKERMAPTTTWWWSPSLRPMQLKWRTNTSFPSLFVEAPEEQEEWAKRRTPCVFLLATTIECTGRVWRFKDASYETRTLHLPKPYDSRSTTHKARQPRIYSSYQACHILVNSNHIARSEMILGIEELHLRMSSMRRAWQRTTLSIAGDTLPRVAWYHTLAASFAVSFLHQHCSSIEMGGTISAM
jgi:hypothetical protein